LITITKGTYWKEMKWLKDSRTKVKKQVSDRRQELGRLWDMDGGDPPSREPWSTLPVLETLQ
jgi:hypothetical protein